MLIRRLRFANFYLLFFFFRRLINWWLTCLINICSLAIERTMSLNCGFWLSLVLVFRNRLWILVSDWEIKVLSLRNLASFTLSWTSWWVQFQSNFSFLILILLIIVLIFNWWAILLLLCILRASFRGRCLSLRSCIIWLC